MNPTNSSGIGEDKDYINITAVLYKWQCRLALISRVDILCAHMTLTQSDTALQHTRELTNYTPAFHSNFGIPPLIVRCATSNSSIYRVPRHTEQGGMLLDSVPLICFTCFRKVVQCSSITILGTDGVQFICLRHCHLLTISRLLIHSRLVVEEHRLYAGPLIWPEALKGLWLLFDSCTWQASRDPLYRENVQTGPEAKQALSTVHPLPSTVMMNVIADRGLPDYHF